MSSLRFNYTMQIKPRHYYVEIKGIKYEGELRLVAYSSLPCIIFVECNIYLTDTAIY